MIEIKDYLKFWNESAEGNCMPLSNDELTNGIKTLTTEVVATKNTLYYDGFIKCNIDGDYILTEKGLKVWKTINHKKEEKAKESYKGGEWNSFRSLLSYYIECIKQEERPEHVFYTNDKNRNFFIPESFSSSWLRELNPENEIYELNIKFNQRNKNAIHRFKSTYDEDDVLYLGYPILATKSTNGNILYYPVGVIPLTVKLNS